MEHMLSAMVLVIVGLSLVDIARVDLAHKVFDDLVRNVRLHLVLHGQEGCQVLVEVRPPDSLLVCPLDILCGQEVLKVGSSEDHFVLGASQPLGHGSKAAVLTMHALAIAAPGEDLSRSFWGPQPVDEIGFGLAALFTFQHNHPVPTEQCDMPERPMGQFMPPDVQINGAICWL